MKLSEAENRAAREEAARRVRENLETREKRLEDLRKGKTSLQEGKVSHRSLIHI